MQSSTTTNQSNGFTEPSQAGENPNKEAYSEVIKREPIEGTPFEIIGNQEKGYFIALGKFKITETENFDDRTNINIQEFAQYLIETKKWDIILNAIAIYTKVAIEVEEIPTTEQK